MDMDEMLYHALVGTDAGIAVFRVDVTLAVGFQQGVGEHGRAGALQIVALTVGRIHYLIPKARLLVLPLQDGVQVFLQQAENFRAPCIVLGQGVKHFDERHRIPTLGASPAMLRESSLLVGPEGMTCLVVGMTVQSCLGVEGTLIGDLQLVHGIVVDGIHSLLAVTFGNRCCEHAEGQSHEDAVEPYLIGVDGLVPEHAVVQGAWLVLHLLHHQLHGQQILLLRPLLVHAGHKMSCTKVIEVIIQNVVAGDVSLLVYHLVGIHFTILQNVLAAVAQVGVEHAFQLDAHHVTPLGFVSEVKHVRPWHTLHFRVCQPFRIVLVRFLL